jgi:hypothetical protein
LRRKRKKMSIKEKKTLVHESKVDEETKAVLNWLGKHHLKACWIIVNNNNDSKFEIKREGVAVSSGKVFKVEERNNLTYLEMKNMIVDLYKELKQKESENNGKNI